MNYLTRWYYLWILERALKALPPESGFNMRSWAKNKMPSNPDLTCGTSACAIGLACTLPAFKRKGFVLGRIVCTSETFSAEPIFENRDGYDAVKNFFGITFDDALWLFCPDRYPRPFDVKKEEVIERIRYYRIHGKRSQ